MVGSTGISFIYIYTCHELCFRMLWQFSCEMDIDTILVLGICNLDGFMFADDDTTFTYLTTHFAIERRIVEY